MKSSLSHAPLDAHVVWFKYRKEILGVIVLVIIAAVGFAGYRLYQQRRAGEAAILLGSAKSEQDYRAIFDRYSDTPASASAYLLLAQTQQKAGQRADSNKTLQEFVDKFPGNDFVSTARMAMAANLESLGKDDEARSLYQQIASANPPSFNAPNAMLAEARLLLKQGKTSEARQLCENVMVQFGDRIASLEARQMLGAMPALATASPNPTTVASPSPASTAAPPTAAPKP
ncbi:MAG: tetratricopeptide repeat protein [Verrucomicrobiota bacterium]|nr:tetratricopeptide repeat protein [Verrucomicrobiota bacterium]